MSGERVPAPATIERKDPDPSCEATVFGPFDSLCVTDGDCVDGFVCDVQDQWVSP